MAIATLSAVYNNSDVFKRVVKIRKGLSCDVSHTFLWLIISSL